MERVWADSHYTSRFRSVAKRHCSVKRFSCVIKRTCSHWQERLRHVSVPFRCRCWARMFDVTEWVRTGLYLFDSDNVNSLTSPPLHFECLLATSAACFCLQKWIKKLTLSDPTSNLVRQYDFPVLLRCRKMSDTVFVAFVRPLSEPVRRFSSCSTHFRQQIAQVVLFLFLHVFLF
jgi:hypothetical protein